MFAQLCFKILKQSNDISRFYAPLLKKVGVYCFAHVGRYVGRYVGTSVGRYVGHVFPSAL